MDALVSAIASIWHQKPWGTVALMLSGPFPRRAPLSLTQYQSRLASSTGNDLLVIDSGLYGKAGS